MSNTEPVPTIENILIGLENYVRGNEFYEHCYTRHEAKALLERICASERLDEAKWFKEKQEEIELHDCCYGTASEFEEATDARIAKLQTQLEGEEK